MTEPQEWYYNTATGEVELGPQSPMQNRLGPYATREDAERHSRSPEAQQEVGGMGQGLE